MTQSTGKTSLAADQTVAKKTRTAAAAKQADKTAVKVKGEAKAEEARKASARKTAKKTAGSDDAALEKIGKKRWSKRMHKIIELFATVVNYDILYIGGGNSEHVRPPLPENVRLVSNSAGITGGARLWEARMDEVFSRHRPFG